MFVLVTLALASLIGFVGLVVDMGFVDLERRTLQKAADAAVMSGALDLANSTDWDKISTDVNSVVSKNNVISGTTTSCVLINNANTVVQNNCSSPTDNTISGVRVTLSRTRQNYFLGVVGLSTVNVSATSAARVVMQTKFDAGSALFIVCGWDTKLAGPGNNKRDILKTTSGHDKVTPPFDINPNAINARFVVHGPQVQDCNAGNNNFKGLYGEDRLVDLTTPQILHYTEGTVAGPTAEAVDGPNGCPAGTTVFNGCTMILPVVYQTYGTTSDKAFWGVFWLPFNIYDNGANQHEGVLCADYPAKNCNYVMRLTSKDIGNWTLGQIGLLGVRMVN